MKNKRKIINELAQEAWTITFLSKYFSFEDWVENGREIQEQFKCMPFFKLTSVCVPGTNNVLKF